MKTTHKLLEISAPSIDDEICLTALEDFENKNLADTTSDTYTSTTYGKRVSSANTESTVRAKKNRAFKTAAVEIFIESDIAEIIERTYTKLLGEEETYKSRGSGFTLESIDGLLLVVYKYTPLSSSSYIQLPAYLENKRATISPKNTDQQCFKWAVLAKHVMGHSVHRLGENYFKHEDKYNFDGISFPHHSQIFQNLKKITRTFPSQKTNHSESVVFCKRCFTSSDDRWHKYKLSGRKALEQHKLICGTHKPMLPVMPKDGDCIKFDAWKNTHRQSIVIYADFKALLLKIDEGKGGNTRIVHNHEAMSYGFLVKAGDDVPASLLKEHGIPMGPVIYRGNESKPYVAKYFLKEIVEVGRKIEKLLKTNVPINMTDDEEKTHSECKVCNLCKRAVGVDKVRDHNHLTGKFSHTLCLGCNLKLQQPKYISCFFHNLSNYVSHYIISELGFDTKTFRYSEQRGKMYFFF
ncbi:Ribonuclease H-like domain [Cinara cedri]|uniref:Ribonuclease H-like domain n=1 Tax=Cinara cedri TaxID=506608 RepID=A0A5E4MEM5_9HEMI|nr:Ribonuclease H-like domain [Cinara cedri]